MTRRLTKPQIAALARMRRQRHIVVMEGETKLETLDSLVRHGLLRSFQTLNGRMGWTWLVSEADSLSALHANDRAAVEEITP